MPRNGAPVVLQHKLPFTIIKTIYCAYLFDPVYCVAVDAFLCVFSRCVCVFFSQDIVTTDLRPDIVIWSTSVIHLVELTVPFETRITDAAERKVHLCQDLADACARSHQMTIITLEVAREASLAQRGLSSSTN